MIDVMKSGSIKRPTVFWGVGGGLNLRLHNYFFAAADPSLSAE